MARSHPVDPEVRCVRTVKAGPLRLELLFKWWGGEYVEICEPGYEPHDVINVFDYEAGKATIPFEQKALAAKVDEWLADQDPRQMIDEMVDYRMAR